MKQTILVVDDEPKIVRLVQQYLERAGFHVVTADNGDTAIQRFYRDEPDLVVLDLMIPGIPGLEVARAIRRHTETPLIMVTALTRESDRLAGLDIGADDYVAKPFSPRELVARVRAVLRRSSATTDKREIVSTEIAPITAGSITIEREKREVRRAGAAFHRDGPGRRMPSSGAAP